MITRHFYPLKGVAEALYQSAGSGKDPLRKTKIAFWLYELYVSEEYDLLRTTIHRIWSRYGTPYPLGPIVTEEDYLHCLWSIQHEWQLPSPFPSTDAETLDKAVLDAKVHRRGVRLYRLLAGLPTSSQIAYLGEINPSVGLQHELVRLGYEWYVPREKTKGTWPSLSVGRRSSRMFCLPKSLICSRSLDPCGLDVLEGSAVWRRILQESGCEIAKSKEKGSLCFGSDEAYESFYATYFPDDIPDEWSSAERAKSHLTN
jgi:hypothetical protein